MIETTTSSNDVSFFRSLQTSPRLAWSMVRVRRKRGCHCLEQKCLSQRSLRHLQNRQVHFSRQVRRRLLFSLDALSAPILYSLPQGPANQNEKVRWIVFIIQSPDKTPHSNFSKVWWSHPFAMHCRWLGSLCVGYLSTVNTTKKGQNCAHIVLLITRGNPPALARELNLVLALKGEGALL